MSKLFGSLNRCFTELFHKFSYLQSSFTSAGTSSFVTFLNLEFSVYLECLNLSIDFLY